MKLSPLSGGGGRDEVPACRVAVVAGGVNVSDRRQRLDRWRPADDDASSSPYSSLERSRRRSTVAERQFRNFRFCVFSSLVIGVWKRPPTHNLRHLQTVLDESLRLRRLMVPSPAVGDTRQLL